jgi:signal transduction histidine kinase
MRSFIITASVLLVFFDGAVAQTPVVITRIAEARQLSRAEAAKGRLVHLHGIVTWRGDGSFTIQDEAGGIYVNVAYAKLKNVWAGDMAIAAKIRIGDELELEGVTDRGGFSPPVLPKWIKILGSGRPLPAARVATAARFLSGAEDCQRAQITGVVQGYRTGSKDVLFIMDAMPGRFLMSCKRELFPAPSAFVDAEVRLEAVPLSRFNTRGEYVAPVAHISKAEDLQIIRPAPAPPFELPLTPLETIANFRPEPLNGHLLKVEGTVIYAPPGDVIYIQDGKTGVRVQTSGPHQVKTGQRLYVAGVVDDRRHICGLRECQLKVIGTGKVPEAKSISPSEILHINREAASRGLVANLGDSDGRLIEFEAELVDARYLGADGWVLFLTAQDVLITARLSGSPQSLPELYQRLGSLLKVTGVAALGYDSQMVLFMPLIPNKVDVLLRDASDIELISGPSWWTAQRIALTLSMVSLALVFTFVWGWLLRRQVRLQAAELAGQLRQRRDAAIEFHAALNERTRLAANLHDTLLQTLGGVGYQIDACDARVDNPPSSVSGLQESLEIARRMVEYGMDQVRNSVWSLRRLPLDGHSLQESLEAIATRSVNPHGAKIEVKAEGELENVSDFVAGQALFIAQEALQNALRHARARTIRLHLWVEKTGAPMQITVEDDGVGFATNAAAGPDQGHFGLDGMSARAASLGGQLSIQSSPGKGTVVTASLPQHPMDDQISGAEEDGKVSKS